MDIQQGYSLQLLAMAAAPFLIAMVASAVTWRSIKRPGLFLVFAVLSLWGLANFIYPMALGVLNPTATGPAIYPSAQFNVLLANALLVALIGLPLLWRLRSALRRI